MCVNGHVEVIGRVYWVSASASVGQEMARHAVSLVLVGETCQCPLKVPDLEAVRQLFTQGGQCAQYGNTCHPWEGGT